MKNVKGITLVALVITIIILLILAGISISSISGENGLFKRAIEAREKTATATNEENKTMEKVNSIFDQVDYLTESKDSGEIDLSDVSDWKSGCWHYMYGTPISVDNKRIAYIESIPVQSGCKYVFDTGLDGYNFIIREMDSTKQNIVNNPGEVKKDKVITPSEGTAYFNVSIRNATAETNNTASSITFDEYKTLFENGTLKPKIIYTRNN